MRTDLAANRWCNQCKSEQPIGNFWNNRNSRDGKHSECKECCRRRAQKTAGRKCGFDGCGRVSGGATYCARHRSQMLSGQELTQIPDRLSTSGPGTECLISDCVKEAHARGMCQSHYSLWRSGRPVTSLNHPVACEGCGKELFRSDRRQIYCGQCRRVSIKMRSYGLTARDWYRLLQDQMNACAICGSVEPLHIDHDHECCSGIRSCGKCVRGLLCHSCNIGLGQFRDDSRIIASALSYLQGAVPGAGCTTPSLAHTYQTRPLRTDWSDA